MLCDSAIAGCANYVIAASICCVGNIVSFWCTFAVAAAFARRSALPCVLFTGPCVFGHSGWCVYIGDIGGNTGAGGENKIFMVREPPSIHDNTLHVLETLRFTYIFYRLSFHFKNKINGSSKLI